MTMTDGGLLIGNAERRALLTFATALRPPPPVDLVEWARANIRFGSESPFPGRFDPDRFPFYRRVLDVLSPDHPARVVVLRGSAQIGKTVIAEIFLGGTEDLDPGPFLYVHPTESNAHRWVRAKWWPMVRASPALSRIFDSRSSKEGGTSLMLQERKDSRGMLIVSGANSAASLSLISARRQVQDDLAKWGNLPEGDPEGLADDRSKAFAFAKIFKLSTPHLKDECRITDAFERGSREHYHVPCPHCGHEHPLEWNDFRARIEENPADAFFVCPSCGGIIEERHRAAIVAAGRWVAHNPNPEPGVVSFHLWAAYAGLESWAALAQLWSLARGDPADEQRVWNTTGAEPYEVAGEAPPYAELAARGEASGRPRGIVPIGALLLTLTLDCQDEYVDGTLVGWGRDLRRWIVERVRVEGHIATPEARAELNTLVERAWPTAFGSRRRADLTGIDANAWTDDVYGWAANYPRSRVVMVRGVGGDAAPTLAFVRKERQAKTGKLLKYHGRFFHIGVNGLKSSLYKFLRVADPDARGYISFPSGLEPDYFEQLTAEKRTPVIDRKGFTTYAWTKPRNARNEMLDVMVYGEALAGKLGWRTMTPAQWAILEARHEVAGAHPDQQRDLFGPSPPGDSLAALLDVNGGAGQSRGNQHEPIVRTGYGREAPLSEVMTPAGSQPTWRKFGG
jgi:phage terminase large subunit GpA-like protein